jgi:glutaminyl-tRNA synthetase
MLEHCVRDILNQNADRRMAVLRPLKVVIENYPDSQVEELEAANNPGNESSGTRTIPFSRELYIEQDDFMEAPPKKFFRLAPDREVRLRYGYLITCTSVIKDVNGEVTELRCTYDPATRGGKTPDGRKVKGTLHWVSASHAVDAEVRLYEYLFAVSEPGVDGNLIQDINPTSLEVLNNCKLEPCLVNLNKGQTVQFERMGYFCSDTDSTPERLVLNRTIGLRDSWSKTLGGKTG